MPLWKDEWRSGRGGGSGRNRPTRRADRQLVLGALLGEPDRCRVSPQLDPALPRLDREAVEELVGVQRVVVEEHGPLGAGAAGEAERVRGGGVSPADVARVLGVAVLTVVEEQRGVLGESEAGDPVLLEMVEVGAEGRLV